VTGLLIPGLADSAGVTMRRPYRASLRGGVDCRESLGTLDDVRMHAITILLAIHTLTSASGGDSSQVNLRKAVTLYASFDTEPRADRGGGVLGLATRFNDAKAKGSFMFAKDFDRKVFRIARDKGVHGGALEVSDVLPNNGRIFFPAKGNLAYQKTGWGGAFSVWINTDPNTQLKTPFCDPVQITQKGATNGGIWFDFNSAKPRRDLRMGVFPAVAAGEKPISEDDAGAPMVRVPAIDFKAGQWHHVVVSWNNFDTGKSDAQAILYIEGKQIGEVKGRPIAMDWDVERAGIYVAVNFIGLLDEFAVFGRPLSAEDVALLHREPGVLAELARK
jgi:hypothetical protein